MAARRANGSRGGKGRACPMCGAAAEAAHAPFCSPRCADEDLGRWLRGAYVIPTEEAPDQGEGEDDEEA